MSDEVEVKELPEAGEEKVEETVEETTEKKEDASAAVTEKPSREEAAAAETKEKQDGEKEEAASGEEKVATEEIKKKPSYKELSDELATIGTDLGKDLSKEVSKDLDKPLDKDLDKDFKHDVTREFSREASRTTAPDPSRASLSRLMNKKLESDSPSTRLTSSLRIDEDALDREIAARMQAFSSSSAAYKPPSAASSAYSLLPDSHLSSYSSKTSPYHKNLSSFSYSTSSSFYPSSSSSPYMTESGANTVKTIFESRIKDLETDLENERVARSKSDKQRLDAQKDVGVLKDRLEDATINLNKQTELNRRREQQLQNVSRLLDESQTQAEQQLAAFKRKHQDTVAELMDQVDELHKSKQKSEKEKLAAQTEAEGLRNKAEEGKNARTALERQTKGQEEQLRELHLTLTAMQREFAELQAQKGKHQGDVGDLRKKNSEMEKQLQDLMQANEAALKENKDLAAQLREKDTLWQQSQEEGKALREEIGALKEMHEDDKERQAEMGKRLSKAIADAGSWQQKCQSSEVLVHPSEVEEIKKRFVQRLQESEAKVDATIGKMVALEKARVLAIEQGNGLRDEIEKLQNELALNEKRNKQHDRVVEEWKEKVEEMRRCVEEAHGETRSGSEKTQKVHQQLEDASEVAERLRRENKNLNTELQDLTQQLELMTTKASDVDKQLKKAEAEKVELEAAVNEKDLAWQKEAAKLQRLEVELSAGKEDQDRRVTDKEEEIEALRKSHAQSLANLTSSLETEARAKLDELRINKQLEQTISDLELEIANLHKGLSETDKVHKKYQLQLDDVQALFEDEEQMRKKAEEELQAHLSRSDGLKDEVDVLRLQVESLERNRKMLEGEAKENAAKMQEQNHTIHGLSDAKKKLESTFQLCRSDNEDQQLSMRRVEEALKKATLDNNLLSDELRREQKNFADSDKLRKTIELQAKELAARLETSEQMSVAGGKAAWSRLEQRVGELELELETERSKGLEKEKGQRKQERKLHEMELHLDEQQNMQLKLGELCGKMQGKLRAYKKYLDDAEQVTESNLAKFRKVQSDLEEAEARAGVAERLVEQLRSKAIASVTGGEDPERLRKVKIEE